MATYPTFEAMLLEVSKSLGLTNSFSTKEKNNFKQRSFSLSTHQEKLSELFSQITLFLELPHKVGGDLLDNILRDYQVHKQIELKIRTCKSSSEKIIWHYLIHHLIPGLARHAVFWNLEEKMDSGMPGGKFWYLPNATSEDAKKLNMPVSQVMEWLINLIEAPKSTVADNIDSSTERHTGYDDILKTFYNWQVGKHTPEIKKIQEIFSDDAKIIFHGCFIQSEHSKSFDDALRFVIGKGHTPKSLQNEISISEENLNIFFHGTSDIDAQQYFVDCIIERYQQPSMRIIRSRLIAARAIQDGYERLLKFLTPNVDKFCTDMSKNKVLQLIKLYEDIYNLTSDAHYNCKHLGIDSENKYFTKKLPPYLRLKYLPLVDHCIPKESIVPATTSRLHDAFSNSEHNKLEDIFPATKDLLSSMAKEFVESEKRKHNESREITDLKNKLEQNKAPFKTIDKICRFKMLNALIHHPFSNQKIYTFILQKMKTVAETKQDIFDSKLCELHFIQHKYNKTTEGKAEQLISELKANDQYPHYQPYVLKQEAQHLVAQNKFTEAEKVLKQALEACTKHSFGKMRGEIAKLAFSVAIADKKLNLQNHEKYHREMFHWGCFDEKLTTFPSIYDVARELHESFWNNEYRNYQGYEDLSKNYHADSKSFIGDFTHAISGGRELQKVLKKHKSLKSKQLSYPQSDTILLLLIKIMYDLKQRHNMHQSKFPSEVVNEVNGLFSNWAKGIEELIQSWPKLINLTDFKNQTPLMFVTNHQDIEIQKLLLEYKADPNIQDCENKTALHAAVATKNIESVKLLLLDAAVFLN